MRPAPAPIAAVVLAMGLAATGCDPSTRGDLGHVRFRWDGGLYGCLFGCDADEPIARGAIVDVVVVNSADLPSCTASSDAPDVLAWSGDCDGLLRGEARATGRATLVLTRDLDATVLDRLEVDVGDADRIVLGNPEEVGSMLLATGGRVRLLARLYDPLGRRLVGIGGVAFELQGAAAGAATLATARGYAAAGLAPGSLQDFVEIVAGPAAARGTLVATTPSGASTALDVGIVADETIVRVEVHGDPARPRAGEPWLVEATAFDAAGARVHAPPCAWEVSPADGVAASPALGRDAATFVPVYPGALLAVSCRVGSGYGTLRARVRS